LAPLWIDGINRRAAPFALRTSSNAVPLLAIFHHFLARQPKIKVIARQQHCRQALVIFAHGQRIFDAVNQEGLYCLVRIVFFSPPSFSVISTLRHRGDLPSFAGRMTFALGIKRNKAVLSTTPMAFTSAQPTFAWRSAANGVSRGIRQVCGCCSFAPGQI
jgi:hypothetical protein